MKLKVTRDKARLVAKILTWMVGISEKVEKFFNIIEKWINKHEMLAKLLLPYFISYLFEFIIIRFILLIILIVGIATAIVYKILETIRKYLK